MSFLGFNTQVAAASLPTTPSSSSSLASPAQLAGLHAVSSSGSKKGTKRGRIIASFFNSIGPRPFHRIGSLEQSIVVTLEASSFLLSTSTVATTYASTAFTLSLFPVSAYTSLFDQYRIDELELWIEPRAAQGATVFDTMYTCVDLDDANVPTSVSDVSLKQGALIGMGGSGRYHRWQPHMAVAVYSGAFTSYGNEPAGWIDCASPAVQHFGFKAAFAATPVSVLYSYEVRAKVTFRGPGL